MGGISHNWFALVSSHLLGAVHWWPNSTLPREVDLDSFGCTRNRFGWNAGTFITALA